MSCLVSNVSLCQAFSHAQLDSQSIEYFNVIRALRWLGMKKGCVKVRQATSVLWPSMLSPTPLSLPKHSIPPQPSTRLKENTHRIYQRLESDRGVREEWMVEIVWHWNDNSPGFQAMEVFILMCPICTFMTRDSSLDILFNQLVLNLIRMKGH